MKNDLEKQNTPPLSFEEFREKDSIGIPKYNNFVVYFRESEKSSAEGIYKEKPHYKKFQNEHPALDMWLRKHISKNYSEENLIKTAIMELIDEVESDDHDRESNAYLKMLYTKHDEIEQKLYEAYSIMQTYGVTDEELFQ